MSHTIDLGYVIGPKGEQGEQGIQGIQGIQGVQGEQGLPGVPGTANISDDILATKHTIATNNGTPYIVPNDDSSSKRYINLHGDSFGICSTARSNTEKKVTLDKFRLVNGARISVRFTDTTSDNPSSGNITLNVNETGAKTIVMGNSNKDVVTFSKASEFCNNIVKEFLYDGQYWVILNDYQGSIDELISGLDTVNSNLPKYQLRINKNGYSVYSYGKIFILSFVNYESTTDSSGLLTDLKNDIESYLPTTNTVVRSIVADKNNRNLLCISINNNVSIEIIDIPSWSVYSSKMVSLNGSISWILE